MTYLKIPSPDALQEVLGGFFDIHLEAGVLRAACCFISHQMADKNGTFVAAVDDKGDRYQVLIPEFAGLKEGVSVIRGLYEPGITTRYLHV